MYLTNPLFIDDIQSLREEILSQEQADTRKAQLWRSIRNGARGNPEAFPWHTPLVALITQQPQDIENAKKVIDLYLGKLEPLSFNSGLQLHFWCFAFPHAKWATYFQWLCTMGAYTPEEQKERKETFLTYHFLNFYYGMNTKPEPECVDNQTLSLALSCTLVGFLFSQGNTPSAMASIMYRDGLRRLPDIIGNLPPSGYTGEGSAYMDCVNGAAIPIAISLLTLITGEKDLLFKRFPPNQTQPIKVLEIVAREWMPGGLLLPWDSYGYQYGTRAAMAYAALHTGQPEYFDILENKSIWSYDVGIGWAFDDLPWTLVWWLPSNSQEYHSGHWFDPSIGGILQSKNNQRYAIQLWDESAPNTPSRMHVNPNAVLFNAYETPLSADGTSADNCRRFHFEDTYHETDALLVGETVRYNFGEGCAGGHSVVLVDDWEGMRAFSHYPQHENPKFSTEEGWVSTEVTPMYQEHWPDVQKVVRKTMLHHEHFFTIEDLFVAEKDHKVTRRFLLRPQFASADTGIKIETPEGVTLHLFDVLGSSEISTETIDCFPKAPDGSSTLSDFSTTGKTVQSLMVAFISRTREIQPYLEDFACLPDDTGTLSYEEALTRLAETPHRVPLRLPAYMETSVPIAPKYWYQKKIDKTPGKAHLVLPRGLKNPQLWINGEEIDLSPFQTVQFLQPPHVELPSHYHDLSEITVIFCSEVHTSHFEGNENGMLASLNGGMALAYPMEEETVQCAVYKDGQLSLQTNQATYHADYPLMEV